MYSQNSPYQWNPGFILFFFWLKKFGIYFGDRFLIDIQGKVASY